MTTSMFRLLAIGTLATALSAGTALAQSAAPVLTSLEVRQLVASNEPSDHARLRAHFTALADRYAAAATRHTAMARGFAGNPSRSLGVGMSVHCRRLAEKNAESAATVRELAKHHDALSAGVPSVPPADATRFQQGAGAPEPTAAELQALAAKASTPAEHRGLEEYFLTLAKRYTADAADHAALAQSYRGTRIAQAAVHCDRLVAQLRESAKEATEAATMHRQFAAIGR